MYIFILDILLPSKLTDVMNVASTYLFNVHYGGKGVSEHFRITHNSIVLSPQTIKIVVISPRIIQTK